MKKLVISILLAVILTGCVPLKPLQFSIDGAAFSFTKPGSKFPLIAISPDMRYLAAEVEGKAFSPQTTFVLWDLSTATMVSLKNEKTNDILSTTNVVSFSPDGKRLLVGGSYGLRSLAIPALDDKQILDDRKVKDVAWTPDGKKFLTIGQDVSILGGDYPLCTVVKNFDDNSIDKKLKDCIEPVPSYHDSAQVKISPDGRYVLSSRLFELFLSDMATGELLGKLSFLTGKKSKNPNEPDHSEIIANIEFSQDSNYFAFQSGYYIGFVNFYNIVEKSGDILKIKTEDTNSNNTIWSFERYKTDYKSIDNFLPKFTKNIFLKKDRIIISMQNGFLEIYDSVKNEALVKFILFEDGEWIIITKDGYYNSSTNGDKYFTIVVNGEIYSYEKTKEKFYRPDLVKNIIAPTLI